jgi:hypothetical protein
LVDLNQGHRYKLVGGKRSIEVRVRTVQQLFDIRDPAPFRDRDLDDDFVEYLEASGQEIGGSDFKVMIHIEEPLAPHLESEILVDSIRRFFNYKADLKRAELKSFLKRAQLFLLLGLLVLTALLSAAQSIPSGSEGAMGILREGLVIFGWVSVWKPIELMLFDWYPIYEKSKLYRQFSSTEVEIVYGARSNP